MCVSDLSVTTPTGLIISPTSNEYPGFVILNVWTSFNVAELTVLVAGNWDALCVLTTAVTIPTKVVIEDWTFAQLPES